MTGEVASRSTIERVDAPTRAFFFENYVRRNRPVILTGVSTRWSAMSKWNPDYLKAVAGHCDVTVHFDEDGNFHRWYLRPDKRPDRKMPLNALIDMLQSDPPERRYYMTEHDLNLISKDLLPDVDLTAYIDEPNPQLFVGRDTCMPLHYHGVTEALLCQLQGRKKVTLFAPTDFSNLYPGPWNGHMPLFSRVDYRQPDHERFPRFRRANPLEFTLEPGEILFIPVHWWHVTSVAGITVSVTALWRARLSCYTFPAPGLQTCAREVTVRLKRTTRRLLPFLARA